MSELDLAALSPELGEAWIPARHWQTLLVGAAFAVIAIALAVAALLGTSTADYVARWAGTAVFGAISIAMLRDGLSSGARGLRLDRGGFALVNRNRKSDWRWDEVQNFHVVRYGQSTRFVGFDLRTDAGRTRLASAGRAMTGADRLLANYFPIKPPELAALMERWRARYAAA